MTKRQKIDDMYNRLFAAQMNRDWKEVDKLQTLIARYERESQMATDQEGLRD